MSLSDEKKPQISPSHSQDEESATGLVDPHVHLDLNTNVAALIKNPLAGIPRAQLLKNVQAFANEKGLTEELPILTKGAIRRHFSLDFYYLLN